MRMRGNAEMGRWHTLYCVAWSRACCPAASVMSGEAVEIGGKRKRAAGRKARSPPVVDEGVASEGVGSPTNKIEEGGKAAIDTGETNDELICIYKNIAA